MFILNYIYIYLNLILDFLTGISSKKDKDSNNKTFVDIKLCVKSKFKFLIKVSSAHYLLFSTGKICFRYIF